MSKITLQDLKARPFELQLTHPITKEPLGVYVKIVGKNSTVFKNKFYDIVEAAQAAGMNEQTPVEKMRTAEKHSAELVATCVVGWNDDEFFGGAYTPELAAQIINNPELSWVKDQLDAAIVEESHFFIK